MRFDLAGGARSEFGDGGHDVVDEPRIGLDDVLAPAAMPVLAHPPAHQRPVVDGHQRGFVRPVLGEQPRRARAPRRAVQHVAVVGAEPAEHRRVVGAHRHRDRIQLQHLDSRDQPLQMRAGDRAGGPRLTKSLGRNGYPPGLRDGQPAGSGSPRAENTGPLRQSSAMTRGHRALTAVASAPGCSVELSRCS